MSSVNFLPRFRGKSAKAALRRGWQDINLSLMDQLNGWTRLQEKISHHWSMLRVEEYVEEHENGILVDPDAEAALQVCFGNNLIDKRALVAYGAAVSSRKFSIFGKPVPAEGGWPWTTDWRYQHAWPFMNAASYDFEEPRTIPYDAKFPWELSRLWFLLPLFQKALLEKETEWNTLHMEEAFRILEDFRRNNPYGSSINWAPTEVALRGINLVFMLDMAISGKAGAKQAGLLLEMITTHGEWLWRTFEYGDDRGYDFTASMTALLAMGAALSGYYPEAQAWQTYAIDHLQEEVLRQFTPDGVNVEGSTSYHRLVTELFLLAKTIMQRQGVEIGEEADFRLHAACLYAACYTRPDGLAPVIGDTDDTRLFGFDPAPPRRHATLIALGAVLYEDPDLKTALAGQPLPPVVPWILGLSGTNTWLDLPVTKPRSSQRFKEGGAVIVRDRGSYLFMDVGIVGQQGIPCHGHNDVLSFELCLEGHPFIVDTGCPTYTGDPIARNLFRSTAYHNSLVIDGHEIADLQGPFGIRPRAVPHSVSYHQQGSKHIIIAGHSGYRIPGVDADVRREVALDTETGEFTCQDSLSLNRAHKIDRYFHFAPGVTLEIKEGCVIASLYQHRFEIFFDPASQPYILTGRVSEGYGLSADAPILVLSTRVESPVTLHFSLKKPRL
jgi:hypothetical protein